MATAPEAAAIPVDHKVLLDGHDGDLVSLLAGVLQDPVDHGLLVGAVAEAHPSAGLAVEAKPPGGHRHNHIGVAQQGGATRVPEAGPSAPATEIVGELHVEAGGVGAAEILDVGGGHEPAAEGLRLYRIAVAEPVAADRHRGVLAGAIGL